MYLSRNPNRYTIKELATLTAFHRNTTKKAISRMDDILSMGSGNYTSYYMRSMTDHYRTIGKALKLIFETEGHNNQELRDKLRAFGYALVKSNLEEIIDETYIDQYNHDNLFESLIHLKLSYPFEDLIEITDNDGETHLQSSVRLDFDKRGNTRLLKVDQCLCRGEVETGYLCEMVAGALQAGLHFACQQFSSRITHIKCHPDGWCMYEISDNTTSEEDETVLDDFL